MNVKFKANEMVFVKCNYIPMLESFRCVKIKEYHKGEYKLYCLDPTWNKIIEEYEYTRERETIWINPDWLVSVSDIIPHIDIPIGRLSNKQNALIYYKYVEWLKSIGIEKTEEEFAKDMVRSKLEKAGKDEKDTEDFINKIEKISINHGKLNIKIKENSDEVTGRT